MEKKNITVAPQHKGKRLDKFISESDLALSRAAAHRLIEEGLVSVCGLKRKSSYQLRGGESIVIVIKEPELLLAPLDSPVSIIYEDDDILVIDKPQGVLSHPLAKHLQLTVVNALLALGKKLSSVDPMRPGIVHRLDKETSGLMVIAKNNDSHNALAEQFKQRTIKKFYRAICWGSISSDKTVVDLPLGRDDKKRVQMKVKLVNAKQARTEITVLQRFKDCSFTEIRIFTGRMHQIRVHMKFLGYPIVGDKKYGIKDIYKELMLHSYKLGLHHPKTDEFMEFIAPMPERFEQFIKNKQ